MKKLFPILMMSFVGLMSKVNAQSSIDLSLSQTARFIEQSLRVTTSPQVSQKYNNHSWHLGPSILIIDQKIASEKVYPKLIGLTMVYKYYPIIKESKINFFIQAQSSIQRIGDKWTSQVYDYNSQHYIGYNYENIEKLIFLTVGYGIELKIGRHFYLTNDVGIGTYYSSTKTHSLTFEAPQITFFDKNINGYSNSGFTWQVGLSLHYIIYNKHFMNGSVNDLKNE